MKKTLLLFIGLLTCFGMFAQTVTDKDGNTYQTVKIGDQRWMKSNLRTTKYNNGDAIGTTSPATLSIAGESDPQYQWAYDGNENNVPDYGRLYTWYVVTDSRGVCPAGYRIPTANDWTKLPLNGLVLMETGTTHWLSDHTSSDVTNESGFTARPAGERYSNGSFVNKGGSALWWSSTSNNSTNARVRGIAPYWETKLIPSGGAKYLAFQYPYDYNKSDGISVRCIAIPSLTNGAGEQNLGKGEKTNEVTEENVWRWSEYYYGYLNISNIVEEEDACKAKHTYVFGEVDGATVEYRMKFGEDYSMLVLRGKADDPAPIKMEIYVDTELKATATWDNGDNCNEETTVYIPDVDYGTHYIAVKYIKDSPDPAQGNYQRFYFDGLKVIRTIPSLTNGAGEQNLGKGEKTDEVTDENVWRWAERYYGYLNISNIVEEEDACKAKHTYVFGEVDGATVEYRMKFGGDYSMLVLRGKADDPAPIKMEIYVDTELKATATWDNGDNCNEETTVYIPDVDYGTHYIAVKYIKKTPDPTQGNYQRFYFDGLKVLPAKYKADWSSLDNHKMPTWFDDSKLGLSIHWGVYSVPAWAPPGNYAEWYFHNMHADNPYFDYDTYQYHQDTHTNPDGTVKEYDEFIPEWKAENYNPVEWVQFAKDIGAKYIFITAKHHDGFCLWGTEYTNRNSVKMGPKRDIINELVEAARKEGLKVGLYYSLFEWFNPLYLETCEHCNELEETMPDIATFKNYSGIKPFTSGENYVDNFMIPQIKELITTFNPDFLYFDGEDLECPGEPSFRPFSCGRDNDINKPYWKMNEVVSYFYNQAEARGQEVYVNDRLGRGTHGVHGDLYNVEYSIGEENAGLDHKWSRWQGIATTFGYHKEITVNDCLSSKQLIDTLVKTVCINGNFDINIGPKADGTIPSYEQETLRELGRWLKVNGEAIYGTSFWDNKQKDEDLNVYYTTKGVYLYAIFTEWPGEEITLNGFKEMDVSSVQMLGGPSNLEFTKDADKLIITNTADEPEPKSEAYTFKIKIKEGAKVMYFNDGSLDHTSTLIHPVVFDEVDKIDFNWTEGTPDIKIGSRTKGENNFSARYEGTIMVKQGADYTFRIVADDGVRFWINDGQGKRAPIERWHDNRENDFPDLDQSAYVTLYGGKYYPFRLEYFHRGNALDKDALLRLEWKKWGTDNWEVVPSEVFGPPLDISGSGLKGSYFDDNNITVGNEKVIRTDEQINFSWDKYDPDSQMEGDGKFAVVWEGKIQPLFDGDYDFFTSVNNNSEIESMTFSFEDILRTPEVGSNNKYHLVGLQEGKKYNIRIEYYKNDGSQPSSRVTLKWESDNKKQNFQLVPTYCLFPPDEPYIITPKNDDSGLLAKYYNIKSDYINKTYWPRWPDSDAWPDPKKFFPADVSLALEPPVLKYANNINFEWEAGSPDCGIGADYFISEWVGFIKLPDGEQAGDREFELTADDGSTLLIGPDKIPVINRWENRYSAPNKGIFYMAPNTKYEFYLRHFERGGSASAGAVLKWAKLSTTKSAVNHEVVPPKAFSLSTDAGNAAYELLVFGEDRSNSVSILNSLQYQVTYTNNVQDLGTLDLSTIDQIWYVDYKKVPDGKGKKNLRDYMLNGGKVFFVGENFEISNSAYPLWRDSLFNALGAGVGTGGVKQSQTINPTKIGFYYTNPGHILSNSPFTVASVKHLSTGNGTFESKGNGTVIAGTEPGGKGYPIAVAFDYGELSFAPNSRAVVYLNSNNGENWNMYAANIAEYLKQPIPETVLSIQDGNGQPGFGASVKLNLKNLQDIAGVQFIFRDIPNWLSVNNIKTTTRAEGFDVAYNEDGAGKAIVILYSTSGKIISKGEGPIAELILDVSPIATVNKTVTLGLENVILSSPAGTSVSAKSKDGTFHITTLKGDVNSDGKINILDVVRTIFIILEKLEPTEIEMYAADCNSDEHIDILDVVCIVNLSYYSPQQPGLKVKSQSGNTIELETENLLSGQDNNSLVQANLTDEIAGLQLRFSYDPKNLTPGKPAATSRTSGMTLSSLVKDGELIVLMYSLNGSVVKPGDGPILSIPSSVNPDAKGTSSLQLKEVILVGTDAREIPVSIITGIDDLKESMPKDYSLYQNYPNPFSSETVIKYELPHAADISIKVYNSLGQGIRELVSDYREAGVYTVTWNGKDSHELSVSPGIYIYEFNADGSFIGKKKMVVLK